MQSTTSDIISLTPSGQTQQLRHHPPLTGTPTENASRRTAARPGTPTEDYVTLSSARSDGGDTAGRKKPSLPVSSEEKQALLNSGSPQYRFSVYG
jgi:hypothetical protein